MDLLEQISLEINQFSEQKDEIPFEDGDIFVQCPNGGLLYAPVRFLSCHEDWCELLKIGYVCESHSLERFGDFKAWFEERYHRPMEGVSLLTIPDDSMVHRATELLMQAHEMLLDGSIVHSKKDIPLQIGEWYAKSIFGLTQCQSYCERGFKFYRRNFIVEVKVVWGEIPVRGVKVEKRRVEKSKYCLIVYLADNLKIQDICILDSSFVMKKWSNKGEFFFLRDEQISQYFFSRSTLHKNAIQNVSRLLKFSAPDFAERIEEILSSDQVPQPVTKREPESSCAPVQENHHNGRMIQCYS